MLGPAAVFPLTAIILDNGTIGGTDGTLALNGGVDLFTSTTTLDGITIDPSGQSYQLLAPYFGFLTFGTGLRPPLGRRFNSILSLAAVARSRTTDGSPHPGRARWWISWTRSPTPERSS